jgi:hypothetical protein
MDFSQVAANTIEFLKPCLLAEAGKLAKDGLDAARRKLFGWLKSKFTRRVQCGALEDAAQSPQDPAALKELQRQICLALEEQEDFRQELIELLPEELRPQTHQTANVAGDSNKTAQIIGDQNTLSIS